MLAKQQNLKLYKHLNNRISVFDQYFQMMHFYNPKSSHSYQKREQEFYGCLTKTEPSADLFLKRTYNSISHEELCYYNTHQNHQALHNSHMTGCKMSLKKTNIKTFTKTPQLYIDSQKIIPRGKTQYKLQLCQNNFVNLLNNTTAKFIERKLNPDLSLDKQICGCLKTIHKQAMQFHNPEFHLHPPQTVHLVPFNKPKINFQAQSLKIGHLRCKSQNNLFQNNNLFSKTKTNSSSKNVMSAILKQHQKLQNKNQSTISIINQNNQKITTSKLSLQTNISSQCSKKSLIHLTEHNEVQNSIIYNENSEILNNTTHNLHIFIGNSKKLKKIDEILEVQSLGDENEAQSDCESIVLSKEDKQSLEIQDEDNGGETWRITQKRLVKVSKLLKSQSVDIL